MGRSLPAWIALGAVLAASPGVSGDKAPGAPGLTVSLAVEQQTIVQPFPARVMLRFHNTGAKPLWLYRHVRDPMDRARSAESGEGGPSSTNGGSRLVVHLERAQAPEWSEPPRGTAMASVGMPHPNLAAVDPGSETTEGAVVALDPGFVSHDGRAEPVWGRYQFSVSYQASYSNGDALARDLGVDIWQGEAVSNTIDVDLEPAPASASGSLSVQVTDREGHPQAGVLVSLSDHQSHVLNQVIVGPEGEVSFERLPPGTYWITARRLDATSETAIYEHVDLGTGASSRVHLVMLEPELYQGKQFWHKPVLLRVTNNAGEALDGVEIDVLKTNGDVEETVRGETDSNGTATLDLIPGRSYVTLKHRKCQKTENRLDVAEGDGIDGEALEMDCKT
jgi:hypothetical protein